MRSLTVAALASVFLSAAATGDPRHELRAHGIRLDESRATLAEDEVEALVDGLRALPSRLRFERLTFAVSTEVGPFGMGDQTLGLPLWSNGRETFHLYAFTEPDDERAVFRTEKLDRNERKKLWRRRAMVHAIIQKMDDAYRVSRSEDFLLATGWLQPGDRPLARAEERLNAYPWAYSRALGMQSASLDLVTFAEEALVTPASISPDRAEPVDDSVACQEFTKSRILRAALSRAAGSVEATALENRTRCPLFSEFGESAGIDHVELILSAPSSASPESLFGHLMLRPVYKWERDNPAPAFQPVMEIGAFFGIDTRPAQYIWRGLTGNSTTFFAFNPMTLVKKRSLEHEQRSLMRFKLRLTSDEVQRVMERMWELERRGYFPYYFFTENCAAWMQFLIDSALAPERRVRRVGTYWVMPLATVDAYAPLLEPLDEPYLPSGTVAVGEAERVDEAIAELQRHKPQVAWGDLLAQRGATDGSKRRAMYAALVPALQGAPRSLAQKLTRALLKIERYAADHAAGREQKIKDKARILDGAVGLPTANELLASRQKRYQRERPIDRFVEDSSAMLQVRTLAEALPLRPFTSSEQAELDAAVATREAYEAIALLHASVSTPEENRTVAVAETLARRAAADAQREHSLFSSGSNRLSVGAAAFRGAEGALKPAVYLRAAVVAEELGEPRVVGFGPEYDVRLGEARALMGVDQDALCVFWADVTAASIRSLGLRPELARTALNHHVGWGFSASYQLRRAGPSGQLHRALIDGDLFPTTFRNIPFSRYLTLGAGAVVEVPLFPGALNTGLRSTLLARLPLPGHGVNAIRAELTASQRYGLLGPGRLAPIQEATAAIEVPFFAGAGGRPGLVIRPRAEAYARRSDDQLTVTGFVLAAGEWN